MVLRDLKDPKVTQDLKETWVILDMLTMEKRAAQVLQDFQGSQVTRGLQGHFSQVCNKAQSLTSSMGS